MPFSEDFLHYLWKFRLFNKQEFKTSQGENIKIINVGLHNKNAGPDFENAKILLGDTVWAGSVEIHLCSSDWENHKHQQDRAYDNVILHVVYIHDKEITRNDSTEIPVLVLKDLIPDNLSLKYSQLMRSLQWIPCEAQIQAVDAFHVKSWLSRILIERLEEKSVLVNSLLIEFKGSWDDAFYITLANNFGFKTNSLPFEFLARSLPQQILARHKNNPLQIEALLFGQAGFLNADFKDDYPSKLKKEYIFLKEKYSLNAMDLFIWKYMRMRPLNFPTVRIAQFAALIVKSSHLFSKIIEVKDVKNIRLMFESLEVNSYWETHYRFDHSSSKISKQIGLQSINNILINTVALFLFSYGKTIKQQLLIDQAIFLLENLPPETNHIVSGFKKIGIQVKNADESQAVLQLKRKYCDVKKCLHCGIGTKILNFL